MKKDKLWAVLALILTVILCFVLISCKTIKVEGETHKRDSTRVEYRVDSFYHYIHDSVRVQLPCSDSIDVAYVERWHDEEIRDKKALHDTIRIERLDSIPYPVEVEKVVIQNSPMAKAALWYMWVSIAAIALVIGWKLFRK